MARSHFAFSASLSLVLACALWGIATVISKQLLNSVPPVTLLVLQLSTSVVVLWALTLASGLRSVSSRDLVPVALIGVLNPGLSYTLSMLGLAHTTASVATLLWAAEPAIIIAFAAVVLREAVTARLVALTITAASGVVLVSGLLSNGNLAASSGIGPALILGGVACCALYTVLSRKFACDIDPLLTVTVQQTAGLVFALAIWPFEMKNNGIDAALALPSSAFAGAMITGLLYYAFAFWLYLSGLRRVPASTAGMYLNLTPVIGVTIAFVWLGERLTSPQWLGAGIILASVLALLTQSTSEDREVTPNSTL